MQFILELGAVLVGFACVANGDPAVEAFLDKYGRLLWVTEAAAPSQRPVIQFGRDGTPEFAQPPPRLEGYPQVWAELSPGEDAAIAADLGRIHDVCKSIMETYQAIAGKSFRKTKDTQDLESQFYKYYMCYHIYANNDKDSFRTTHQRKRTADPEATTSGKSTRNH